MPRLIIGLIVAAIVFTIYALVDSAVSDKDRVRGLPKWAWLLVIVFLPVIGGVLWFLIGRPRKNPGSVRRQERRVLAPDDDPDFLGKIALDREQEDRIRKLEDELSHLDEPSTDGPLDDRPLDDRGLNSTDKDGNDVDPGTGRRDA